MGLTNAEIQLRNPWHPELESMEKEITLADGNLKLVP